MAAPRRDVKPVCVSSSQQGLLQLINYTAKSNQNKNIEQWGWSTSLLSLFLKIPGFSFMPVTPRKAPFPKKDVKVCPTCPPWVLTAELLHSQHPGPPLGITVPNTPNWAQGPGCHQVTHGWRQTHGHRHTMALMSLRQVKMMLTWKPQALCLFHLIYGD